jgi:hypothetical protein
MAAKEMTPELMSNVEASNAGVLCKPSHSRREVRLLQCHFFDTPSQPV